MKGRPAPRVPRKKLRLEKEQGFAALSASPDRRSENVRVLPIVISELELGNVQRHIFAAHFVEGADHATLEDRPETLDGLSVNRADDVLTSGVINDAMRILAVKMPVTRILIGAKQAELYERRLRERTQ